ncbi:MAG: KpsF/GutQ family sugar-phosphate isomerase [Betaproteobacteria bacterium]|nr:KpsF/GutQ family sugar-phosphate isomerase [Betaproteobacteria bacterium]
MIIAASRADTTIAASGALGLARQVLAIEAEAVAALIPRLDERFLAALGMILNCRGRVVVSGVGKSGHVARKVASTMASTGTPAFFVSAAEASHGDLGMITREDVLIAVSYSGESAELLTIIPLVKRQGAALIAITGNAESALAKQADVHLDAQVAQEACPLNLAPTASTTAALALGDALAIALLDARGFGAEDFARAHPGGELGRRLLTLVSDVMRRGEDMPAVGEEATLAQAILEISRKRMGMTAILDAEGRLIGVFTDGDLRRSLERDVSLHETPITAVMTRNPHAIGAEALAAEAVQIMERFKTTQLPVVDKENRLIGALNIHDLFRAKVL